MKQGSVRLVISVSKVPAVLGRKSVQLESTVQLAHIRPKTVLKVPFLMRLVSGKLSSVPTVQLDPTVLNKEGHILLASAELAFTALLGPG